MANVIYYDLTVLASSPAEINAIEERLKEASAELVAWVDSRFSESANTSSDVVNLVSFQPVRNIFYLHPSVNKARVFHNSFKRWTGIVDSHLNEVSREFPAAIFLLDETDCQSNYFRKRVTLSGVLLRELWDNNGPAQMIDWALLDIFNPFKTEYELGLPFGSLWYTWLADVTEAVRGLRMPVAYATEPPEPCDLTFKDEFPGALRVPKPGEPVDLVQKQWDGVWKTLCNLCHRPIRATVEGLPENGDEDFGYDTDHTVCFEVIPCNVTIDETAFSWGAIGPAENWRKFRGNTFVACAECFAKLGVSPSQLAVPTISGRSYREGDIAPSSVVGPAQEEYLPPEPLEPID